MEAGTKERELSGEKVERIVAAMRESVAARGIAGATFDHVSREAGVSRGLLHYYFGTKERLLVEVLRRDSEMRVAALDESLAPARTVDDFIAVLVASLEDMVENDPGFFMLIVELFSASRRNPEMHGALAELYDRSRQRVADILRQKESEGVLSLRMDAEAVTSYLFSAGDGAAIQMLADPERDHSPIIEVGTEVARFLLARS
jgi:AcrR family transcriptional regulator